MTGRTQMHNLNLRPTMQVTSSCLVAVPAAKYRIQIGYSTPASSVIEGVKMSALASSRSWVPIPIQEQ